MNVLPIEKRFLYYMKQRKKRKTTLEQVKYMTYVFNFIFYMSKKEPHCHWFIYFDYLFESTQKSRLGLINLILNINITLHTIFYEK